MYVCIKAPSMQVATGDKPLPVQVECLHQLKGGKHHKHKVQRSGI